MFYLTGPGEKTRKYNGFPMIPVMFYLTAGYVLLDICMHRMSTLYMDSYKPGFGKDSLTINHIHIIRKLCLHEMRQVNVLDIVDACVPAMSWCHLVNTRPFRACAFILHVHSCGLSEHATEPLHVCVRVSTCGAVVPRSIPISAHQCRKAVRTFHLGVTRHPACQCE